MKIGEQYKVKNIKYEILDVYGLYVNARYKINSKYVERLILIWYLLQGDKINE